jgi:hypothetical protein
LPPAARRLKKHPPLKRPPLKHLLLKLPLLTPRPHRLMLLLLPLLQPTLAPAAVLTLLPRSKV